jgi:hypothetical protein
VFESLEETGIPALQRHAHSLSYPKRRRVAQKQLRHFQKIITSVWTFFDSIARQVELPQPDITAMMGAETVQLQKRLSVVRYLLSA